MAVPDIDPAPGGVSDLPDFGATDEELRRSGSIKWTFRGPDVLPAWVAEMDVRPSRVVRAAVADAVERGAFGYPAAPRETGLAEATAGFVRRRFGAEADPERILPAGDVMSGIRVVIETLCEDAPVIVPTPSYPPFLHLVPLTGRRLVTVPCVEDRGRQVLDLGTFGRAFAAGAKTVLLSNPHNPLGRAFSRDELVALRQVADRYGARVISDEVHAPLVLPGASHVPWSTVSAEDSITVMSTSKAWNTPGLKCAQILFGSAADAQAVATLPHVANAGTTPLGIAAAVAAYTAGDTWLDGLVAHLDARRLQFGELMAARLPSSRPSRMEATYLSWVNMRHLGGHDPAAIALSRGKLLVNAGATFGRGYDTFVRVNLGTSEARLTRLVDRLVTAFT